MTSKEKRTVVGNYIIQSQLPIDAEYSIRDTIRKLNIDNSLKIYNIVEELFRTAYQQGQQDAIESIMELC